MAIQGDWAFCEKCYGLFYNGFNDKGRCPATPRVTLVSSDRVHIGGQKRHPQAYHFVLRYWTASPPTIDLPSYHCGWPHNPRLCPGY